MRSLRFLLLLLGLAGAGLVAHADRQLIVPPRVQTGPTCGLYALGMTMDYHHAKDGQRPTALVLGSDLLRSNSHTQSPTTDKLLFSTAQAKHYTKVGGMFHATQLAQLAEEFGYRTNVVPHAGFADVKTAIDRGNPVLMAFDVNREGNPGREHGEAAHWTVLHGYSTRDGVDYVHATHAWDGRLRIWRADDFFGSSYQLERSTGEDSPGDISQTLAGRMIEVGTK